MSTNTNAPKVQKRCAECNKAHYDSNFMNCRSCGASLPASTTPKPNSSGPAGYDF